MAQAPGQVNSQGTRGPVLILASRSPRRAELLEQMRLPFRILEADIDETPVAGERPAECVERLATLKAKTVFAATDGRLPVLGADTLVVQDGMMLGKPVDRAHHLLMLKLLSGRTHEVLTGICVVSDAGTSSAVVRAEVEFIPMSASVAEAYVDCGEGRDKAGGYGIQGLGGIFVKRLVGSYSAVVGLPLSETEALLAGSGLDTWHSRSHEI